MSRDERLKYIGILLMIYIELDIQPLIDKTQQNINELLRDEE